MQCFELCIFDINRSVRWKYHIATILIGALLTYTFTAAAILCSNKLMNI